MKVVVVGALLVESLIALLLSLVVAHKPAEAAFPGENDRITFSRSDGNDFEIFAINPDGTGVTQLTKNTTDDTSPAFSPDGTKIAFIRSYRFGASLMAMPSVGGSRPLLLP